MEIDYTPEKYKDAAYQIAKETPWHLNQPTTPPIHWRIEEGGILRVLLADGRTVRAPVPAASTPKIAAMPVTTLPIHHYETLKDVHGYTTHPAPTSPGSDVPQSPPLMALPTHAADIPPNLKPNGKRKPVKNKTGKQ
jgi:hypothetical protein